MSLASIIARSSLQPLAQRTLHQSARSSSLWCLQRVHQCKELRAGFSAPHRAWWRSKRTDQPRSFASTPQLLGSIFPSTMLGFAAGTVGYSLVLSGVVCLTTNVAGFLVATFTKTHKLTDLIGVGTFGVSAWATHIAASQAHGIPVFAGYRPLLLTIGVTFWSVRLAGFLFYRILQTGHDKRLEPFYSKEGEPWLSGPAAYPLKLLAFWSVQACWAWMVLLPVTVSQAAAPMAVMGPWGWAGAAAFFSFWAFEAGADFQKDWFKRQPGNKREFVSTGFYSLCQYPNYFGEIAVWWTMFLWAGIPTIALSHPFIIVSPIFTTYLLRYGSGVANLSYYQKQSYGHREDYREYVAKTPLLLPFMKPFYVNNVAEPAPEVDEALVGGSEQAGDAGAGTSGSGAVNDS